MVEREIDGIEIFSMGEKVGMRMIPADRVSFTNVRVPQENKIGEEDKGYSQLTAFSNEMRIETAAMGIGITQGELNMALGFSKKRRRLGKRL